MAVYYYTITDDPGYYVYFIRNGSGHIKIGISEDTTKRINALQTANATKLSLLARLKLKNRKDAEEIEKELHSIFEKSRTFGEWFNEAPVIDFLAQDWIVICGWLFKGFKYDLVKDGLYGT